jgi:hypothetical protein
MIDPVKLERMKACFPLLPEPGPEVALELYNEIIELRDGRVLTCVYCGQQYPQGTPAAGAQVLTNHIRVCPQHPMRALETELRSLRHEVAEFRRNAKPPRYIGPGMHFDEDE